MLVIRNDPVLHTAQDNIHSSVKLLNWSTRRVGEMGGGNGSFQHPRLCQLIQSLNVGKAPV